ncbi:hypothetical protein FB451DRAFT_1179564 [Mycena latifolia]|nr:hypothetical protein FB451DRAFT_1179564 [Mycena latifolia]
MVKRLHRRFGRVSAAQGVVGALVRAACIADSAAIGARARMLRAELHTARALRLQEPLHATCVRPLPARSGLYEHREPHAHTAPRIRGRACTHGMRGFSTSVRERARVGLGFGVGARGGRTLLVHARLGAESRCVARSTRACCTMHGGGDKTRRAQRTSAKNHNAGADHAPSRACMRPPAAHQIPPPSLSSSAPLAWTLEAVVNTRQKRQYGARTLPCTRNAIGSMLLPATLYAWAISQSAECTCGAPMQAPTPRQVFQNSLTPTFSSVDVWQFGDD